MRWLGSFAVFVLTLIVLKFFFGWPISIGGSIALSLVLSFVFWAIGRLRS